MYPKGHGSFFGGSVRDGDIGLSLLKQKKKNCSHWWREPPRGFPSADAKRSPQVLRIFWQNFFFNTLLNITWVSIKWLTICWAGMLQSILLAFEKKEKRKPWKFSWASNHTLKSLADGRFSFFYMAQIARFSFSGWCPLLFKGYLDD